MTVCAKPLRGGTEPATGTDAGYQRHWRAGEPPCPPCASAHSAHSTEVQKRNPEAHRAANERWRASRPGYFTERQRARLVEDPAFRLSRVLRRRLYNAVRGGGTPESALVLVGCTIAELRAHLEQQFLPGMSWENYGTDGWEVDHIRPVSSFDLADPVQAAACFHFTNLQPLWAADNRAKGIS